MNRIDLLYDRLSLHVSVFVAILMIPAPPQSQYPGSPPTNNLAGRAIIVTSSCYLLDGRLPNPTDDIAR